MSHTRRALVSSEMAWTQAVKDQQAETTAPAQFGLGVAIRGLSDQPRPLTGGKMTKHGSFSDRSAADSGLDKWPLKWRYLLIMLTCTAFWVAVASLTTRLMAG